MTENNLLSYRNLIVWQKAMDMVVLLYEQTENFPKTEQYGLTSQMRRAAISIPSNIAEGRRRGTDKEFRHFLHIAYGSGAELETQLEICKRLVWGKKISLTPIELLLSEVMKMLNRLISTYKTE